MELKGPTFKGRKREGGERRIESKGKRGRGIITHSDFGCMIIWQLCWCYFAAERKYGGTV